MAERMYERRLSDIVGAGFEVSHHRWKRFQAVEEYRAGIRERR